MLPSKTKMDPNDLIKAAPALQSIVTTIVAGVPIAEIVKSIILPTTDVLGKRMANRIDRLFEKTGKIIEGSKASPQPVPEKLLLPLLQGAALEDEEDLHDMWAALLANAASSENPTKIKPGFIATLRQMAADEAAMLNWMFSQRTGPLAGSYNAPFSYPDLMEAYAALGFSKGGDGPPNIDGFAFETCVQNLEAEKLIEQEHGVINPSMITPRALTFRGLAFMYACRPLKP
jgi:hypothetical protein